VTDTITIPRELLRQVLDAFDGAEESASSPHAFEVYLTANKIDSMCVALRSALDAPAVELIYQLRSMAGNWIDQSQGSYDYNTRHGHTTRIVYTAPQAQQQKS